MDVTFRLTYIDTCEHIVTDGQSIPTLTSRLPLRHPNLHRNTALHPQLKETLQSRKMGGFVFLVCFDQKYSLC